ncbi:MAG: OsmC family protein [Pseudomonadota bacterium]
MKSKASALWKGGLKDGQGYLTTTSGILSEAKYSFGARFEDKPGTNPEELIAAAHAGCFSMALSMILGEAGIKPEQIQTAATVTLGKAGDGFAISDSHLEVVVFAPGADQTTFKECAEKAKSGCPVSKALNAKITMNAKLNAK